MCCILFAESTEGITPTVGFLNSSFSLYRFSVTVFDVGGGAKIRSIWKNYYAEVRIYKCTLSVNEFFLLLKSFV